MKFDIGMGMVKICNFSLFDIFCEASCFNLKKPSLIYMSHRNLKSCRSNCDVLKIYILKFLND